MKRIIALFLIFGVAACEESNVQPGDDNLPNLRPLSNQEVELIDATNQFSFNIIKSLDQEETGNNFFISPVSIGYALGMVFNGADGETKQGIKNTLDFGELSDAEINLAYKNLTALLLNMDKKVELGLANSIWYKNSYTVNPDFANKMKDFYDARIEGIDFSAPNAKDIINGWIEDKTNNRIQDMLDEIPADAVMYLVNAIYFKADWTYQFDESATKKDEFFLEDGSSAQVDMMFSEGSTVNYYNTDALQMIDIPYGNKQFSMTILLPHHGNSIDQVWQNMSADKLAEMDAGSDTATVELYLPKFELQYKKTLNEILASMGMQRAFTPQAELPFLLVESPVLSISRVLHQSFLKIDEKGSEAAAATIVEIVKTSVGGGKPKTIRIDRPFGLMIREKHSGAVLFAGKIVNPNQ